MIAHVRSSILFYINGQRHEVTGIHSRMMLADYLRYQAGLTGTKVVCAEGDCGACSVLRYWPKKSGQAQRFVAINSCITPVSQMDGSILVTIEGIAHSDTKLCPTQKAMVDCHGSQCGFCTPGFVITLAGLAEKKCSLKNATKKINHKEAQNALTGNLCRCTGYEPILKAATTIDLEQYVSLKNRYISPSLIRELTNATKKPVLIKTSHFNFFAPTTIQQAVQFLKKNKNAKIVGAATDLGVQINKGKNLLESHISLHLISELDQIKMIKKKRLWVGARVTLSELRRATKKEFPEFGRFLDLFASPQIKNMATLVGNIANASPIADTPPFLLVQNAHVHIHKSGKKRSVSLQKFYKGYKKTDLKPGEMIVGIELDLPKTNEALKLYKTSQRKDLDISCVNAAWRVQWKDKSRSQIKDARLALGGVAATPIRLLKTEKLFKNKPLTPKLIETAAHSIQKEIKPLSDLRGTTSFRRIIVDRLFHRFIEEIQNEHSS